MANPIKCPVCGESNLPDQEFCQYCQSRLQPLTGNLKGADAPLTPGQIPTKKNTAELEPILPQWLREARSSARQVSEEEATQSQSAQKSQTSRPASSGSDLLAGLHSQAEDNNEEDTPDWLTNITGEKPKTKKSPTESSEVRWVELGNTNDFAQPEPAADDTPSWLAGINSSTPQPGEKDELTDWFRDASDSQKPQQSSQPHSFNNPPSASPADETPDWLHSMAADDGAFNDTENTVDESPISSDTPDWLRAMAVENDAQNHSAPLNTSNVPPASSDTPDWLSAMVAENNAPSTTPPASSDAPDWLSAMAVENDAQNHSAPLNTSNVPPVSSDTPDWLRAMVAENDAPSTPPASSDTPDWLSAMAVENDTQNRSAPLNAPTIPPASSDTPDWLRTMDEREKIQSVDSASFSETSLGKSDAVPSSAGDTPDWLKGLESSTPSSDQDWLKALGEPEQSAQDSAPSWLSAAPTPAPEPEQRPTLTGSEKDDASLDIPSWLKAAAPQSSIYDEPAIKQETPASVSSSPSPSSETSDWLNAFKSVDTPEPPAISVFSMDAPVADSVPPVIGDEAQPKANADTLFTEMPDWLSVADTSASPESIPAPITNVDAIAPGDLPSWVQAMRPVDAGVSQLPSTSLSGDKALESRGALAGIQGVLPAVAGFSPTRKPKAYSIKMQASQEQLAHAALLEQILEAETAPVPIGSFSALGTSRSLRWLLALLFFVVLTTVLFMQISIFSMPVGLPSEVVNASNVAKSIPEGSPVLVVFDYEPARVGEMEAAAAPMFDQMHNPRLTFISTNETGAILAERFISAHLADKYQSGVNYLNLGYLPGGPMGIRAFVQNPQKTALYALAQNSTLFNFKLTPAWDLPPVQGVASLSQFAALVVITDNADSARAWIEQTTSAPAPIPAIPFVVISSAQASPMIQPYYASQQIDGLVSGLYGSALVEQNNAGQPGTARIYWDAYSIGMLLAMALILGGGLLNLAFGLRDRAAAREAK